LVQCVTKGNITKNQTLKYQQLIDVGGRSLLNKFKNSPFLLLSNVYPDYHWLPWKFTAVPPNYWNDKKNIRIFLDWAAKQLKVKEMSDWYNVTYKVTIDLNFKLKY
jgi:hypothetical protein